MIHPHDHRCDPTTIDYAEATARLITCTVCDRRWVLLSSGWRPDPITRRMPDRIAS